MLPGRTKCAAKQRLNNVRNRGHGTTALREYLAECATAKFCPWSVEEDQTFIEAHKEGKTFQEITAMLPGRTEGAVYSRWQEAKCRNAGTTALRAYVAECATAKRCPWSVEED